MSRMFIARSRARSGAREVVLNTGCERQSDVASLGGALLKRTAQGESQTRPRGQQGIDLQKSASLSHRRANSMTGTFQRVIPEALDMLHHIEAADGEAHGEVVHISPTCGQDSAENSGGKLRHTLNPNLADFMRLMESILDKQQAKLVVIENVPGELKSGVFRRLSWHGGCACNNPRATPRPPPCAGFFTKTMHTQEESDRQEEERKVKAAAKKGSKRAKKKNATKKDPKVVVRVRRKSVKVQRRHGKVWSARVDSPAWCRLKCK